MIVRAPGKALVTGAYAVLEGAPAVVIAVDRYAELDAATGAIDTTSMYDGGEKLGLGSSAACAVVRAGAAAIERGEDVHDASIRKGIFVAARAAHAADQRGGSGVDVAASTFGGALIYTLVAGAPEPRAVGWPAGLFFDAFYSGTSAKTSDLRARVDALRARDRAAYDARMGALSDAAHGGAAAIERADVQALLAAARTTHAALGALGRAADAPIVPSSFDTLAAIAESTGGAFFPSGAGGGDIGLYLGTTPPPSELTERAVALGMRPLGLSLDLRGLHAAPSRDH